MTLPPRVRAVPPVRNISASSMQSPPASADATRVITLSPVFARPGALPRSRRCWTSSGRPRRRARVAGRISPALATRRVSSKAIRMRSGWLRDSICWVLLLWDRFSVSKTIIPEAQEHFLVSSGPRYTPSFGGSGVRGRGLDGEIFVIPLISAHFHSFSPLADRLPCRVLVLMVIELMCCTWLYYQRIGGVGKGA